MNYAEFGIAPLIVILGMIAHWFKKSSRGETLTTLWQYITTNKTATAKAVGGALIALSTLESAGHIDLTTIHGFSLVFGVGFGFDSGFNKDTEDERNIPQKIEAVNSGESTIDTLNVTDKAVK